MLSDPKPALREAAAKEVGAVFGQNARLFSLITNTLAKDKEIEDRWRHFARPICVAQPRQHGRGRGRGRAGLRRARCLSAPVASLLPAEGEMVRGRNAALLGPQRAAARRGGRTIPWPEAQRLVLDAYGAFSPDLAAIGRRFFEHPWIDAPVRGRQGFGRLRASDGAERASLSAAQLSRPRARRDDAGARVGPRRAPGAGGAAGLPDGRHAADAGRDRLRVRRDADLPRHARRARPRRKRSEACWRTRSRTC